MLQRGCWNRRLVVAAMLILYSAVDSAHLSILLMFVASDVTHCLGLTQLRILVALGKLNQFTRQIFSISILLNDQPSKRFIVAEVLGSVKILLQLYFTHYGL